MMPAAKHFDPVLGVDIHLIQPPGPVPPVPIPHPFVGFLIDPFEYVPIIGGTILVNGMMRSIAGTMGKSVPSHIPIGGMFVKPPGNECEMFMGSAAVAFDGDAASHMNHPTLDCQCIGMPPIPRLNPKKKSKVKSLVLPTGVVLPIPAGPPVLIGGPPTISLMALGMKVGMAALGKGLKRLAGSKFGRRVGAAFKKSKQKLFRSMKPGFIKCKLLRAEPVNVATGEVVIDHVDFELPGRIPLSWTRHYSSGSRHDGHCGFGWETPADARLEWEADGTVWFHDGQGTGAWFLDTPETGPVQELVDGAVLSRDGARWVVRTKAGLDYHFPAPAQGGSALIEFIRDASGNILRFDREAGQLVQIIDSCQRRLQVVSQEGRIQALVLHEPGPDGPKRRRLVRYEYDGRGDLTAAIDPLGSPYGFEYRDHRLVRHTDREGLSFHYRYESQGEAPRCVHTWGDGGLYNYRFEYDDVLSQTRVTDSLGHVSLVEYDADLFVLRETDPLGEVTTFAYDDVGRTIAVQSASGRMEYSYDDAGNLLELTRPDGTTLRASYDERHRPTEMIGPGGHAWLNEWDECGRIIRRVGPAGTVWSYAYNEVGELSSITYPTGGTVHLDRDHLGNLRRAIDPTGLESYFEHDYVGNLLSRTGPSGARTGFEYDLALRLVGVTHPSGAQTTAAYNRRGDLTSVRDAAGRETRYEYSGLSQVARRINPDGTSVQYRFDTEERLTGVINERGQEFRMERDSLGRLTAETDFWGHTKRYEYGAGGHLAAILDPLGRRTEFEFDLMGRPVRKTYHDGRVEATRYDAHGRLISTSGGGRKVTRSYDAQGRLLEETQGEFSARYEYDASGNQVRRLSSCGNDVRFSYDLAGRFIGCTVNRKPLVRVHRNGRGQPEQETLLSGLRRRYEYDPNGWLSRQVFSNHSGVTQTREYSFDPEGLLLRLSDSLKGTDQFRYDPLGQIVEHSAPDGRLERFDHDNAGNLPGGDPTRGERLGRRFDAAGNLVHRGDGAKAELSWDGNNRLASVSTRDGSRVEMEYDALGRRTRKKTRDTATRYFWEGDRILGEESPDRGPREFIFYPKSWVPLAMIEASGEVYLFQTDHIGLPRELVDEEGSPVWSATYDAHAGVERLLVDRVENPLRLPGQYFDDETGLSYNRHRHFDPEVGAFVSEDPLGIYANTNLYRYAPNVWSWIDPLGLECKRLGLGLKSARRGLDYIEWSQRHGYSTYGKLSGSGPFPKQIAEAMRNADEIHFNMEGVDINRASGKLNEFGEPFSGNYTNYELHLLKENKEYRDKLICHYPDGTVTPKGHNPWAEAANAADEFDDIPTNPGFRIPGR